MNTGQHPRPVNFTADLRAPEPAPTITARDIRDHLDGLRPTEAWTPALDLALVEGVLRGASVETVANKLDVVPVTARTRFLGLTASIAIYGWQHARHLSIDGQRMLLVELRARANDIRHQVQPQGCGDGLTAHT